MKLHILLFFLFAYGYNYGQNSYWQQEVNYDIEVRLDTTDHTLHSVCNIGYTNNSPASLDTIYFHFWANAFSSKITPFAIQSIELGMTNYYFAKEEDLGGYTSINASSKSLNQELKIQYIDEHHEIAFIVLNSALSSGDSLDITFNYSLDIPTYYSRLGRMDNFYNLVAWYPKPAVYDSDGWHTMPYLSMGEFYSEYGNFDVEMSVPTGYNVAHSGAADKQISNNGYEIFKSHLSNAHDFSWFTSPNFHKITKEIILDNGQNVLLQVFRSTNNSIWENSIAFAQDALQYMATYMGDYPYNTLTIVEGKDEGMGGAMEYPSIKIIKNVKDEQTLEYYIAHEIAHSWFYAALGSNERTEAFFDEGLATYLEQKYTSDKYKSGYYNRTMPPMLVNHEKPPLRHLAEAQICRHMHQPLRTDIEDLSLINYGLNSYQIGSTLIFHIESLIGEEKLNSLIKVFYHDWKFKHPKFNDFINFIENQTGLDLIGINEIITGNRVDLAISNVEKNQITIANFGEANLTVPLIVTYDTGLSERLILRSTDTTTILTLENNIRSATLDPDHTTLDIDRANNHYPRGGITFKFFPTWDKSDQKEIFNTPFIGYNSVDGVMLSLSMYNSTLPPKDLKWNITPMFGLRSSSLVGQSWISYDVRPQIEGLRKIQYRLALKSFDFLHSDFYDKDFRYFRFDPAIILHHKHSPASKIYSKTSFRQLIIGSEQITSSVDDSPITNFRNQYITRVSFNRYNFDALQPSELAIHAEYNLYEDVFSRKSNYVKLTLDYSKGFAFAENRSIDIRFFVSGFIHNTRRESSNFNDGFTLGSIALLSQGNTDYSFDDYFLDRVGNSDRAFRQIGVHGGAFKDALGSGYSRIGQSNEFATSVNLKSDFPFRLPKYLPLKVFFDIGYFRSKSSLSENIVGKSIYSGGLMLDFADGLLGVYLPVISSKEISDIYSIEDRNLLSRITFSLNLHRFNPWELIDDYNF